MLFDLMEKKINYEKIILKNYFKHFVNFYTFM